MTAVTIAALLSFWGHPRLPQGCAPGRRGAPSIPKGGAGAAAPAHGSLDRSTGHRPAPPSPPRSIPLGALGERRCPRSRSGVEARALAALPGGEPGEAVAPAVRGRAWGGDGLFDAAEGSDGGQRAAIFGPVRRRLW